MNILFIAQSRINANKGGVQRVTATLAKAFKARGLGVCYLALCKGNEEGIDGVPQYYIPEPNRYAAQANLRFIRDLVRQFSIEIVINQTGIYPGPFRLIRAALPPEVKLYSVHHNCIACMLENYRERFLGKPGLYRLLKYVDIPPLWKVLRRYNRVKYGIHYRQAIAGSDRLVLLSRHFIPELRTYLKDIPAEKIAAIPNPAPFEVSAESIAAKEKRVLYVGRIRYPQKRTDLLLDIWKKVAPLQPEWHLDIVGDGDLRQILEQRVRDESIERVHFYGYQDPIPFYRRARIFCMTSAFEGFPMVLTEAMAFGVVPFAFATFSAISDMIHGEVNGIVVSPFDTGDYVAKLSRLMDDDDLCRNMAKAAQEHVTRFAPPAIASQWIALFEDNTRPMQKNAW